MRRSADFDAVLRRGLRVPAGSVVLHHRPRLRADGAALVGLVVSKAVGNSVVRHRVSRRLRSELAGRLDRLAPGSGTVVRALPGAATASSRVLGDDLDRGLERLAARTAARAKVAR